MSAEKALASGCARSFDPVQGYRKGVGNGRQRRQKENKANAKIGIRNFKPEGGQISSLDSWINWGETVSKIDPKSQG